MRRWRMAAVLAVALTLPTAAGALDLDIRNGFDDCERAVRANDANGGEYQPGVDVYGNPVVSADVNPIRIEPPKVIEFPIAIDLAKRLGFNAQGLYEGKAAVAMVRVEGNRVFINGQEVNPDDRADLIAACRASARRR